MTSPRPHSPFKFIRIARRHALVVVIPAVIVIAASAIAIKQLPDLYQSSARLTIEHAPAGAAKVEPSRRLVALRQQVTNRARLEEIISAHNLYQDLKNSGANADEIVNRMRSDIRIEPDSKDSGQAYGFTISYRAKDAATAQKITDALAGLLLADGGAKSTESQSTDEPAMLRQRASELAAQLREQETARPWLLDLKEEAFAGSAFVAPPTAPARTPAPAQADTSRAQQLLVEGYRDKLYALQQQMADIDQRIVEQRRIVEQQKKTGGIAANPTYAILLGKRAELQGQRDNLINRQELTEKHPRVLLITDQIAAVDRQLADLRQQEAGVTTQSPEARELRALESERNRIRIELEVTNRAIARQAASPQPAPRPVQPAATDSGQREVLHARLAQEYFSVKRAHKEAVAALERAETKRQPADSKPESVRLVEQASLPITPGQPDRGMLHLLALAAGLALGASFAAVAERRRSRTLHDCADVEHYTNLPMLVAIPKAMTVDERSRAGRRARLRFVIGTAAVAVATFALTKFFVISNLFALIGEK